MTYSPYPGLRPFLQRDKDVFFGRESLIKLMLDRFREQRFIAILGPRGCGKSSLVNAGIIARLRKGSDSTDGPSWRFASMQPGRKPTLYFAQAVVGATPELLHHLNEDTKSTERAQVELERNPHVIFDLLQEVALPKYTKILVFIDQFEEFFRFPDENRDADTFVEKLIYKTTHREIPVYVVAAIRSDYYGDCTRFNGLPEALNEGGFLVPMLNPKQLEASIVRPAETANVLLEPALLNRLLHDISDIPTQDQLSLTQHVLKRMWDYSSEANTNFNTLTLRVYEAVGSVNLSLAAQAESTFLELNDRQQVVASALFRCLSESYPDGAVFRRPASVGEVSHVAIATLEEVTNVANAFRSPALGFIAPSTDYVLTLKSHTYLDISNQIVLRTWPRLIDWVKEEAEAAGRYRQLLELAQLWASGETMFLEGVNLQEAIAWRDEHKPTKAWASRYGGDFDLVAHYIDSSDLARRTRKGQSITSVPRDKIFISYRRDDNIDATHRIYDWLINHFSEDQILLDIASIPAGENFRKYIRQQINSTSVLLVVIGERWPTGRLQQYDDPVRYEIEYALKQGIMVVPLLVGKGVLPPAAQLPISIRNLVDLNAIEVRAGPDYEVQVGRLIAALMDTVHPKDKWRRLLQRFK